MSEGRILFVSDLHLDEHSPRAAARFVEFLRGPALDARALYILGDLFETWIGDDDDEPVRDRICTGLREFTRRVPCHVLRGNRDFLLGGGFESRSGCQLLPDPARVQSGRHSFLISHGDLLCTGDRRYQGFREFTRDPRVQASYLALPLGARRQLAHRARIDSAAYTRTADQGIMDVDPGAVETLFRVGDADVLIHGHTHRPAVHAMRVDNRERTRVVLADWYESASCLQLDDAGRYETLRLADRAGSTLSMASSSSRV